jgi:hypothetical protein
VLSFFDLRNEIILFIEMKERDVSNIKSTKWILNLAFMVDITEHLNELNLNCHDKNEVLHHQHVSTFQHKNINFKTDWYTYVTFYFCCITSLTVMAHSEIIVKRSRYVI